MERGSGVRTWYLVTVERGATEFLTGITEFDPGASLAPHFHNCQESVMVLEGRAVFEASSEHYEMEQHSTTLVLTGTVHRFQGGERDIAILTTAITDPRSLGFLNERPNLLNVAAKLFQQLCHVSNRSCNLAVHGAETRLNQPTDTQCFAGNRSIGRFRSFRVDGESIHTIGPLHYGKRRGNVAHAAG